MLLRREDIPESEGLVACASYEGLSVGACRKVEHSVGMASQGCNLFHGGVAPDIYLVLTVAMSRNKLVHILCEQQIANLASCLDRF